MLRGKGVEHYVGVGVGAELEGGCGGRVSRRRKCRQSSMETWTFPTGPSPRRRLSGDGGIFCSAGGDIESGGELCSLGSSSRMLSKRLSTPTSCGWSRGAGALLYTTDVAVGEVVVLGEG